MSLSEISDDDQPDFILRAIKNFRRRCFCEPRQTRQLLVVPHMQRASGFSVARVTIMKPKDTAKASGAQTLCPLKGRRVLVVEDDSDTLQIIQFVLERQGAHVMPTNSVPAALDRLELHCPDV